MRQDTVVPVAIVANRGDSQATLEDPLAVDGHGVGFDYAVLAHLVTVGKSLAFRVALAARGRHVDLIRWCSGVISGEDVVLTMTRGACRCVLVAPRQSFTVEAGCELLSNLLMALGTVDWGKVRFVLVVHQRGALVAVGAVHVSVHRAGDFLGVDKEAPFRAMIAPEVLFTVAFVAGIFGKRWHRQSEEGEQR